jgi:hypothetical protein
MKKDIFTTSIILSLLALMLTLSSCNTTNGAFPSDKLPVSNYPVPGVSQTPTPTMQASPEVIVTPTIITFEEMGVYTLSTNKGYHFDFDGDGQINTLLIKTSSLPECVSLVYDDVVIFEFEDLVCNHINLVRSANAKTGLLFGIGSTREDKYTTEIYTFADQTVVRVESKDSMSYDHLTVDGLVLRGTISCLGSRQGWINAEFNDDFSLFLDNNGYYTLYAEPGFNNVLTSKRSLDLWVREFFPEDHVVPKTMRIGTRIIVRYADETGTAIAYDEDDNAWIIKEEVDDNGWLTINGLSEFDAFDGILYEGQG